MWVWVGVEGGGLGEGAPHTPKYLDQFLMVLLVTFTRYLGVVLPLYPVVVLSLLKM